MKSEFLRLRNQLLHYLISGKEDYLIILPSLWVTSNSYYQIGEKLSKYFTVIIPDIYKGKSKFKQSALKIADYILILKEFIEKLKIKECYLIGISYSGLIAANFTNNYPSKIKRLLLVSTTITPIDLKRKVLRLIIGYIRLFLNNLFSIKGLKVNLLFISDSVNYFLNHPKQYVLEAVIAIRNYDKPILEMKVPSRIIFAKKDEFIPQQAIEINSKIKNLELEIVNKTHAWGFIEEDEIVKKIKDYFLLKKSSCI